MPIVKAEHSYFFAAANEHPIYLGISYICSDYNRNFGYSHFIIANKNFLLHQKNKKYARKEAHYYRGATYPIYSRKLRLKLHLESFNCFYLGSSTNEGIFRRMFYSPFIL